MDPTSLINLITGGIGALGVMTIVFALLLTGKLHTNGEMDREIARGDREALRADLAERRAEELQAALIAANERTEIAVKTSQLVTDAFTRAAIRRSGGRGT